MIYVIAVLLLLILLSSERGSYLLVAFLVMGFKLALWGFGLGVLIIGAVVLSDYV